MSNFKKPLPIIIFSVLILILITILVARSKQTTPTQPSIQTFSPSPLRIVSPPDLRTVPNLPSEKGQGLDLESELIKQSIIEINKLSLPYQQTFTSSSGIEVSILIPAKQYQINPWTLTVEVFGIDFNTTSDQDSYNSIKTSFKASASRVFDWIYSQGANPEKIFFNWGDSEINQEAAERWLDEN